MREALEVFQACSRLRSGSWKRFAYEGFDRDSWQQPDAVIEALAIRPGSTVADIGAGGGYFSFRLADAVGPNGRVYAVDIDEDMVAYLKKKAAVPTGHHDGPLKVYRPVRGGQGQ